jgi:NAD(P)-dependent dehydrogenase (short-subunit alcohol dehydrogenase family)
MDLKLNGKSVLITGGSKGIGRACAEAFAQEGCLVHIAARSQGDLIAAAEAIHDRHQTQVTTHVHDLSDSRQVDALFETTQDVDILVNNAGAIPAGPIEGIDEASWRKGWDLKVFGYINMTRRYLTHMKDRGYGVIVNNIGTGGEKLDYDYIAGAAGNASLMAFTRAIGSRCLNDGVRVVGVNSGAVETDRIQKFMVEKAERELGDAGQAREFYANWPQERYAQPEEVADLIVFLASARASYISGTVVTIDGGMVNNNSLL